MGHRVEWGLGLGSGIILGFFLSFLSVPRLGGGQNTCKIYTAFHRLTGFRSAAHARGVWCVQPKIKGDFNSRNSKDFKKMVAGGIGRRQGSV